MKSTIFKCEIITPMFLNGADGRTLEIRAPSIKGMMRFWWRAINGHLSIKDLRKKEGELFGASDEGVGRSKFSLIVSDVRLSNVSIPLMPHHERNFCSNSNTACSGFDVNKSICKKGDPKKGALGTFSAKFILSQNLSIKEDLISTLFKISTILGGFGKRSRRGFGSVEIVRINNVDYNFDYSLDSICSLLNAVVPNAFKVDGVKIKPKLRKG